LKSDYDGAHRVRVQTSGEVRKELLDAAVLAIASAREAAKRSQSMNNLKQIALAMLNYQDLHKTLPPAVFYGPDGKTPYSWRVALLPLLGRDDLYKRYRLDEPWDGPNNSKLIAEMPSLYRSSADSPASTSAAYFALVGPQTVFSSKTGVRFADIKDGAANTILLVEAKRDIPWTKPEDIPYDAEKPVPQLGGFFPGVFNAVLCDCSVHTFRLDLPQDILRLLIDKDDRKPVPWEKIR
jgi:hypothetical protein